MVIPMTNKTDAEKKKCSRHVLKSMDKFKRGKIKFEKIVNIIMDCGIHPEHLSLDQVNQITQFMNENKDKVVTQYKDGDNSNRERGSTHNPYTTLKGKIFHTTVKQGILKSINMAEWLILNKYDKNAFVYDDPRLKGIDELLERYIDEKFQHREYKVKFMHQLRHIFCVMMKEDPYYTSVGFDFMNLFIKMFPDGFELTESEQYNLNNYHTGTEEEIQDRINEARKK